MKARSKVLVFLKAGDMYHDHLHGYSRHVCSIWPDALGQAHERSRAVGPVLNVIRERA